MIKRTCLFIDDEKQDAVFPRLIESGRRAGLEIECFQLNVGNQENREFLDEEEVSVAKVVEIFEQKFRGTKIDLMAFDWNIGSGVTGPLLIKAFNERNIRNKVPKLLYSGVLKDEVEKLCNEYRENKDKSFGELWEVVRTLIATTALDFVSRDNYEAKVVEVLKRISVDMETTIIGILREVPDLYFAASFPKESLKDKTFAEIATILDGDTHLREEFSEEVVRQVLAYLAVNLSHDF